jgi:hypothetical protein
MNESKELLEATIKGLEEKINSLNTDIDMKRKELEDVNKPEMQGEIFDKIHGLVEDGVGEFDFSDSGNYEIEYEIDYDGRVNAHSIELNNHYELVSIIMNKIDREFKVIIKEKE